MQDHNKSGLRGRNSRAAARLLSEALPHIRRYDGATIVIKLGGFAVADDHGLVSLARDVVLMRQCNLNPVIVHGGGPMINSTLERLGIQSKFQAGKRISDRETVDVVEMVLSGSVNKKIVQAINGQGGRAVGISGKDADLIVCRQADPELGMVGHPVGINSRLVTTLVEGGYIPVIAPLGTGKNGETFNVNGDTAAGAVAAGLQADRLLLMTDVAGVKGRDGEILPYLSPQAAQELIDDGIINGGMIPKTRTALDSVSEGVRAVVIMDGRIPNACLLELFTDEGIGTLIGRKSLRWNMRSLSGSASS
ncbi:MAG: acetylglutamate kinase [Paracoccaceae bacterium]|nr:acetylglutamate kinase [Paracoccaceae bacterium]